MTDGTVTFYSSTSVPNTALCADLKTADNIDQTNSLMSLRTSELHFYKCCLWNITTGKLPGVRRGERAKEELWEPQKMPCKAATELWVV
jgi:hypothetical protein